MLRRLARSNMLLVPLDRRDHEYRYHALLQEMLQAELQRHGGHLEAALHERASRWYAEHDDIDHAVKHAIAAGNRDRAGELIWANTAAYASRGRDATLRRWLAEFSDREITESPALCLTAATTSLSAGDGARVEHWTAAAAEGVKAARPTPESTSLESAARVIRAAGAARDGVVQMRADVVGAYEGLPADSPWRSALPPDRGGLVPPHRRPQHRADAARGGLAPRRSGGAARADPLSRPARAHQPRRVRPGAGLHQRRAGDGGGGPLRRCGLPHLGPRVRRRRAGQGPLRAHPGRERGPA